MDTILSAYHKHLWIIQASDLNISYHSVKLTMGMFYILHFQRELLWDKKKVLLPLTAMCS